MTCLPHCSRCSQPRPADLLRRGICDPCRAHTCQTHPRGIAACYKVCGCRCGACGRAWHSAESLRKLYASRGMPRRLDVTGTRRRIQAMWALGWSSDHIAEAAPIPGGGHGVWQIAGNRHWVTRATAEAIAHAYAALSMTSGPSAVTAARARAQDYAVPLAWDDDDGPHGIDNPAATPYRGREPKIRRGDEFVDEVRHMLGTDSAQGIARRLGCGLDYLVAVVARADEDLAAKLNASRIASVAA